ncbi:hypothetical protein [Streptomyces spiralis]
MSALPERAHAEVELDLRRGQALLFGAGVDPVAGALLALLLVLAVLHVDLTHDRALAR